MELLVWFSILPQSPIQKMGYNDCRRPKTLVCLPRVPWEKSKCRGSDLLCLCFPWTQLLLLETDLRCFMIIRYVIQNKLHQNDHIVHLISMCIIKRRNHQMTRHEHCLNKIPPIILHRFSNMQPLISKRTLNISYIQVTAQDRVVWFIKNFWRKLPLITIETI